MPRLMSNGRPRPISIAVGLLLCQLVVALALIPPWQQPDEHAYVASLEVWRSRFSAAASEDAGREADIIRSMAAHDFWHHYGDAPSGPLPARFEGLTGAINVGAVSSNRPPPYYALLAMGLAPVPGMSVVEDMYAMRGLSVLLSVVTLWVAWRGTRECLGETGGATVTVLLALHPQFAVVSTAAAPDALVNLAGACLWWQAMLALRRPRFLVPLVAVWVAAFCGAAVDRMGIPLLIGAFVTTAAVVTCRAERSRATVVFTVAAAALLVATLWSVDELRNVMRSLVFLEINVVEDARTWTYVGRFTSGLFRSWWFSLGWMTYLPPGWWAAVAAAVSILALGAVVWRMGRGDDAQLRVPVILATLLILVQAAAVFWAFYRIGHGAQGRYFFPYLVPSLTLLYLGAETLARPRYRHYGPLGLVAAFALLSVTAWVFVGFPAFLG